MLLVERKRTLHVDFKSFEGLLLQASQVLEAPMEIQTLEGVTIISANGGSGAVLCSAQGVNPERCRAESFDLFRKIKKSGKTVVMECFANHEVIGVPLKCSYEIVGVMLACRLTGKRSRGEHVIALLEEIGERISSEIQHSYEIENISQELSDKYEELNLIYDLGRNLGKISTARKAVLFIIEHVQETFSADIVLVSIPEKGMHEISCRDRSHVPPDIDEQSFVEKIETFASEKFASPRASLPYLLVDSVDHNELAHIFTTPVRMLSVPIKLKGALSGVLSIVTFSEQKPFETGDTQLLISLSEQLSMALTNVELYENIKDVLLNVVKTLVYSIEAKDYYTKGHSERVNALTMMIADALEISEEDRNALNWASILHDIGKIGVPEGILTKKGKLTSEEYRLVQEHPERGFRILMPIEQLKDSLEGILHHHEKIDGTGYPLGLKGNDIPLHAKIIAIADTYDAMTTSRSYREGLSREDAIAELTRVKGTQLDAEIVDLFIPLINNSPRSY